MSVHESIAGEPDDQVTSAARWSVDDTPFAVSRTTVEREVTVAASGEVDISTASRLRSELADAMSDAESVVIDLTDVTFMDSHGLRVLIEARVAADERPFVVSAASPNVRRLINVSGLGESFGFTGH